MKFEEVLQKIREPEKLISPVDIDELLFWVDSFKTDAEEELNEVQYTCSNRLIELLKEHGSVAKAESYLKVEDIYRDQKKLELRIKKLGAFKSNLRRRYEILTNKFR